MEVLRNTEERLSSNTPLSSRLRKRKRSDDVIARKGYNSNNTVEDNERIHDLESEAESVYHGYDTEKNDYTLEKLSKDITRSQESKEYRDLMSRLKEKMKEKYPERLRKL